MLTIGPWLTPVDRSRVISDFSAVQCHVLAVTFHGELLKVGGEPLQVLFIRQHRDRLRPEEIGVPDREQAHEHG